MDFLDLFVIEWSLVSFHMRIDNLYFMFYLEVCLKLMDYNLKIIIICDMGERTVVKWGLYDL